MTNEMKLLTAFIRASGFDVEEYVVSDCLYRETVIDYKVTKRPTVMLKDVIVGDIPLTQYIQNILELKENDEKYRFIIYSREIIDTIIKSGYFIIVDEIEGGYLIEGVRVIYEKI